MSAFGRRNSGRRPIGYFAEFIIIIAGISVSFLLNEWRENNKVAEKKLNLLQEISSDLKKDSTYLDFSITLYEKLLASHDSLLLNQDKEFVTDSLSMYVDHTVSYYPFQETQKSFLKITNDPNLTINKNDSLLEYFLMLHNQLYKTLHEWASIEREFVLDQLLPYMNQQAPFLYPPPEGKLFQGEVFYTLKEKDAYLNLIKSGRTYKAYFLQVAKLSNKQISHFKEKLDRYLEEVEN